MNIPGLNADAHFGNTDDRPIDWRTILEEDDADDADDELLDETPEGVIAILGFDPKELDQ